MASVTTGRGISLHEDWARHMLQGALIGVYRSHSKSADQNRVAQSLRPLWRELRKSYADLSPFTGFPHLENLVDEQRWEEEDFGSPHDPRLRAYVDGVLATVRDDMGLRCGGEAAPWALAYVHADATLDNTIGWRHDPAFARFPKWERVSVGVHVTEEYAQVTTTSHNGETTNLPGLDADVRFGFQRWDELKRAACDEVERQIERIAADFENSYPRAYQKKIDTWGKLLPTLRQALIASPRNRPHPDDVTRKALGRLAEAVGVDYPKRRTRTISASNRAGK